jgi:hypothetical protein
MSKQRIFPSKTIVFPFQNYQIKRILLQTENGPCPILALVNLLSLRGGVFLDHEGDYTSNEIIQLIKNYIIKSNSSQKEDDNLKKNLDDALYILPQIVDGMNLNVKFKSVSDFEYTQEHVLFDMCAVTLFHGWVVPEHDELYEIVNNQSYNSLQEKLTTLLVELSKLEEKEKNEEKKLISELPPPFMSVENDKKVVIDPPPLKRSINYLSKNSFNPVVVVCPPPPPPPPIVVLLPSSTRMNIPNPQPIVVSPPPPLVNSNSKGEDCPKFHTIEYLQHIIKELTTFITRTPCQFTYQGLLNLIEKMNEKSLYILFKSNHFTVITKYKGQLFELVFLLKY